MFVKINDSAIINTEHVVWIDGDVVRLTDGTEHKVLKSENLKRAIGIINSGAKVSSYTK